ncbi:MAG: hypothetical protein Q9167_005489 [Letrouitia subvulpina]
MPGCQSTVLRSSSSKSRNHRRPVKRTLNALTIAEAQNPSRVGIRKQRLGELEVNRSLKHQQNSIQQDQESDEDDDLLQRKRRKTIGRKDKYGGDVELLSDSDGNEVMIGQFYSDDDESLDSDEAMGLSKVNGRDSGDQRKYNLNQGRAQKESGFVEDGTDLIREDTPMDEFDEESILTVSEDEQDAADSAKLASLHSLVSTMNQRDRSQLAKRSIQNIQESSKPSEFGIPSNEKLTMADLAIPSQKGSLSEQSHNIFADNRKGSFNKRKGMPKTLEVPLPKRQQDRLDRAAAYEKSKQSLDRWTETVKHNRRAEHLFFPLQDPNIQAIQKSNKLQRSVEPRTDLETEIQKILEESGLAHTHGRSEEDDILESEGLQTKKIPLAELQARQAELRRKRDLLFREEIRARRINKIKSKTYRRVHRKERDARAQQNREVLVSAGVESSDGEKEKQDRQRAEARMGAKYRESRWAKGMKESGRTIWDGEARGEITEMARRNEELKRRMTGNNANNSESEITSSEEENESNEENEARIIHNHLDRLKHDHGGIHTGVNHSALSSLKFMQSSMAAEKIRNDESTEQLQNDLLRDETPSGENEEVEMSGRRRYGPTLEKNQITNPAIFSRVSPPAEMPLSDGDDNWTEVVVLDQKGVNSGDDAQVTDPIRPRKRISRQGHTRSYESLVQKPRSEIEDNPWLSGSAKKPNGDNRKMQDSRARTIISNLPPTNSFDTEIHGAKPLLPRKRVKPTKEGHDKTPLAHTDVVSDEASEAEDEERLPQVLGNEDLVRRAFAGDEVVADFEKEKQDLIEDEDEKTVDNTLPGWGNWVGAGIGKKQQRRNKGRILSKEQGTRKEKRQDSKLEKVMINERQIKKNAKYLALNLPHPFETRQQYERSLRLPIGPEWTTKETFQAATKPKVLLKQGIIAPMVNPIS